MFVRSSALIRTSGPSIAAARLYSNGAKSSETGALFLSDLLKRVDAITTKAKESEGLSAKLNNVPKVQKRGEKVMIENHPLAAAAQKNRFERPARRYGNGQNQNHNQNQNQGQRESRPAGDRPQRSFRNRQQSSSSNSATSTTPSTSSSTTSTPQRRPATRAPAPRKQLSSKPAVAKPIQSKKLHADALKPQVNADTFLYGKITSSNATVSNRVASLTKETLIESKYPYKMPKEIIEKLANDDVPRNRFLLQRNFNLNVDDKKFSGRFETLVKGKISPIEFDAAKFKGDVVQAEFSKKEIMKNATLTSTQKQSLFDTVNGIKSIKDLVGDVHWVKK
ncbi:uncharacterized protein RJT20DRAFT_137472 [Scheffersomyces xylosifermentans]|uniref:uncharacterized protein n=1 Tax=Scheffersomyces xylosifermentans TaxID=1304137 RepID=UPI00315DF79B